MKKIFSIFCVFFLTSSLTFAQTVKKELLLYATTPSTFGNYDQLRLIPRGTLANCSVGAFYVPTSTNRLMYCTAPNTWVTLSPFEQTGDDIRVADTNNPELKTLSIGTSTPEFMLTLDQDGGIIAKGTTPINTTGRTLSTAGAGIRMIWYPRKAAFRAGGITAAFPTRWDDANIGLYSTAFGRDNIASGQHSVVGGGERNQATQNTATVAGGGLNQANGVTSTVGGGAQNIINTGAYSSFIGGGTFNDILANAAESVIGGGLQNTIGADASWSTIAGGRDNEANAVYSVVMGGYQNRVNGAFSTISGGNINTVDGVGSWIGGQNLHIQDTGTPPNEGNFIFAYGFGGTNPATPKVITQNYSAVFWGVNVGMGTVAPTHRLHIKNVLRLEPIPGADPVPACDGAADGALFVNKSGVGDNDRALCFCVDDGTPQWEIVWATPAGDCL